MEQQPTTHSTRLLSDRSTCSNLSTESCEYYETEIYELLPSVQASRAEQNRSGCWESSEANQGGPVSEESHGPLLKGQKDKACMQPLKNIPMCIQAKRDARERRKMQLQDIGFWKSWWRTQSIHRKRAWEQMGETLSRLLPWQHTLRVIEGKFGAGVKAYFVFFRYIIYLNLLHCALICGFILGPTTFYGTSEPLKFEDSDSVLNFFEGTGYLNRSPVFYGFYKRGSLTFKCLNTPLLYLAGVLTILILSLIMVVRRTTVGYKHTWMLNKRFSMNVSYKIFCGWDFTIQDPGAAILKHSFIRNDLKLFLEEQRFSERDARRTLGQRVRLYLLRFFLNMLVLSLLGGAFYLIIFATQKSQTSQTSQGTSDHRLFSLLLQYLPPITISVVNLVLPVIFSNISSFEDYSSTMQVNTTLVRSIFLKLASLGIYLFFLLKTSSNQQQCTENLIGRDMYKLCIFNFLVTFCNTFFWNYPRKLMQEKFPRSLPSGKQHFLIPFHVLDLVNIQTVFWVGVYHCPLLPLIGVVLLVATFYMKKFTVLRCCVAEQRLFQGSNSSVLFHFMLLLGLLMAAATLGFHLYDENNTSTCGPFGSGQDVYNVTGTCVDSLPQLAQSTVRYLASEAFALPLILAEIIILTSYVSRGRANRRAIDRLKDMLVMSSSDKRFLVKQHATVLRRRRVAHRDCSGAAEGDDLFSPGGVPAPSQANRPAQAVRLASTQTAT